MYLAQSQIVLFASLQSAAKSMEPRPYIFRDAYFVTEPPPSRIVCKAYSEPPGHGGRYITSIAKGSFLGPVDQWAEYSTADGVFVTVQIRGWWINVWKEKPTSKLDRRGRRCGV